MSISPASPADPTPEADSARARRILRIVFLLFCLEVGLILLLLPWTLLWDNNYFFSLSSGWRTFWLSSYLRGAVSGLGLVNLWIASVEGFRLIRRR